MNVHSSLRAPLSIAALALVAGCGGGVGDQPSKPAANLYGSTKRLCEVVGPATWEDAEDKDSANCDQPADHAVNVSGLGIIAIDRYDETGDGAVGNFWLQDPVCAGKPYSGVTVYNPSFSPPALRLAMNDVVDVDGQITEFLGPSGSKFGKCRSLPEITGTLSFRFDGIGSPEPVVIDVLDLKSYETARPWLGMLVKVENITLAEDAANSGGRFTAGINTGAGALPDRPKITNELYDIEHEGPALTAGMPFKSVTGVVTYFYGFHLVPRSPADFEP